LLNGYGEAGSGMRDYVKQEGGEKMGDMALNLTSEY
jgi:hypothetical protein